MHIPHQLSEEFPDEHALIKRLFETNHDFRTTADRYEELNREILRIESGETPTSDVVLEDFKRERLRLKDHIAEMLNRSERRM